jgi:hypothetical protein
LTPDGPTKEAGAAEAAEGERVDAERLDIDDPGAAFKPFPTVAEEAEATGETLPPTDDAAGSDEAETARLTGDSTMRSVTAVKIPSIRTVRATGIRRDAPEIRPVGACIRSPRGYDADRGRRILRQLPKNVGWCRPKSRTGSPEISHLLPSGFRTGREAPKGMATRTRATRCCVVVLGMVPLLITTGSGRGNGLGIPP